MQTNAAPAARYKYHITVMITTVTNNL